MREYKYVSMTVCVRCLIYSLKCLSCLAHLLLVTVQCCSSSPPCWTDWSWMIRNWTVSWKESPYRNELACLTWHLEMSGLSQVAYTPDLLRDPATRHDVPHSGRKSGQKNNSTLVYCFVHCTMKTAIFLLMLNQ